MKKISFLIIVIMVLMIFVGCEGSGNYPKDDGRRYATALEAVESSGRYDVVKIHYEVIDGNFVKVEFAANTVIGLFMYKDEKGYFPLSSVEDLYAASSTSNPNRFGIISVLPLAGKYVISFTGMGESKASLFDVTDNYGNEFKFADYEQEDRYDFTYMLVLDEIPKDYVLLLDGYEEKLPTITGMQMWITVGIIIGAIIALIMTRKIIKKWRQRQKRKITNTMFK